MYEEAKGADGTSTVPESLRAHHGWGSERAGVMGDSASNDNEAWARQQEEAMQDAEKRVVDRAEQALRQNGHFLTFQEQEDGQADEKPNGKKKGKGKSKSKDSKGGKEGGGCLIF